MSSKTLKLCHKKVQLIQIDFVFINMNYTQPHLIWSRNIDGLAMLKGWMKGDWQKRFMWRIWVAMLEGEDVGEHFLTELGKFY
jgi:hypothetical protein